MVAIQPIAVALRHNLCQSGRAKIVLADTLSGLDYRQSALNHIQNSKICNNTIHNTCARERQATGRQHLAFTLFVGVIHDLSLIHI